MNLKQLNEKIDRLIEVVARMNHIPNLPDLIKALEGEVVEDLQINKLIPCYDKERREKRNRDSRKGVVGAGRTRKEADAVREGGIHVPASDGGEEASNVSGLQEGGV